MRRATIAGLLIGTFALVGAGCGGDDSDEGCGGFEDAAGSLNPQDPNVAQLYADMAKDAPSEIKGDLELVSDRMRALEQARSNPQQASSALAGQGDMSAALSRISTYISENC